MLLVTDSFLRSSGVTAPLEKLLAEGGIRCAVYDRTQANPTVMDNVAWDDAVMQEEIFGPVLPILTFDKFEEVFTLLSQRQKPLALYLFSEDKAHIEAVTSRCRYGGGCVNDVIIHLATSEMGFGGVGESGMGSYHCKDGFDAFSHAKSIVDKKPGWVFPCAISPTKLLMIS